MGKNGITWNQCIKMQWKMPCQHNENSKSHSNPIHKFQSHLSCPFHHSIPHFTQEYIFSLRIFPRWPKIFKTSANLKATFDCTWICMGNILLSNAYTQEDISWTIEPCGINPSYPGVRSIGEDATCKPADSALRYPALVCYRTLATSRVSVRHDKIDGRLRRAADLCKSTRFIISTRRIFPAFGTLLGTYRCFHLRCTLQSQLES